ncbi:MAG: hypothetical protein LBE82_00185 [Chitinophagaceae bacterium]|jgi:hypothetical protein|nr:hypothetical protein [Chitinophagaceae bacterium]
MKAIFRFLFKAIILPFYQRNSGFFLLLFVLFAGIIPNVVQYHYRLMKSIVSSTGGLVVFSLILVFYGFKCVLFILKKLNSPDFFCIKNMQTLPPAKLYFFYFITNFIVFLPFFIYTVLAAIVGVGLQQYAKAYCLICLVFFLNFISAALYRYSLFRFKRTALHTKFFPAWQPVRKLFFPLLCWHSFYTGKIKLCTTKFFSLCFLFIPLVWNRMHFDFGDFILLFHFSIACHALVVFDYVRFLELRFIVLRNLPIVPSKIFLLIFFTLFVIVLPEAFVLLYFKPVEVSFITTIGLVIYLLGMLSLFIVLSYETGVTIQSYTSYVAIVTTFALLLSPFKMFIFTGTALFVISLGMFKNLYYKYEAKSVSEE